MNFANLNQTLARLNHILIPATKESRDRARRGWLVRAARPLLWLYQALTDEGRLLAVASLLIGGAGLEVISSQVYLLWCIVTGALVAALAVRPWFALTKVRVEVDAPRQVTVGEEVRFHLIVVNEGEREHRAIRVSRPLLPWDGTWITPKPGIPSLPPGAHTSVTATARFVQRGHHHLDSFWANAIVPFGLAQGNSALSAGCHFLVVPRIAKVTRLRTRESSRYQPGGVALASKTGESMELLGVRPYRQGDAMRDLHARSWARLGKPVVREYQQEYFSRIGVILDTDASVAQTEQLEAAISLAAGVVAYLSRGEALIDLLVVGDRVHPLTLGRSLGYLEQALDHLACVEPGRALDARMLVQRLAPFLSRLSCVVLVALSWDAARIALAEEIRSRGVACRSLLVHAGEQTPTTAAEDLSVLSVHDITAGEALFL
ncbi:MAG: DUF58 domain-containing protein [Gammaproteobacteria bacterium]